MPASSGTCSDSNCARARKGGRCLTRSACRTGSLVAGCSPREEGVQEKPRSRHRNVSSHPTWQLCFCCGVGGDGGADMGHKDARALHRQEAKALLAEVRLREAIACHPCLQPAWRAQELQTARRMAALTCLGSHPHWPAPLPESPQATPARHRDVAAVDGQALLALLLQQHEPKRGTLTKIRRQQWSFRGVLWRLSLGISTPGRHLLLRQRERGKRKGILQQWSFRGV